MGAAMCSTLRLFLQATGRTAADYLAASLPPVSAMGSLLAPMGRGWRCSPRQGEGGSLDLPRRWPPMVGNAIKTLILKYRTGGVYGKGCRWGKR